MSWHLTCLSVPASELIRFVADRPGHDRRYAIDASRIHEELGWEPQVTVQEGLRRTVTWYLANPGWWQPLLSDRLRQLSRIRSTPLGWLEPSPLHHH